MSIVVVVVDNKMLSTVVSMLVFVVDLFLQGVRRIPFSSIDRYRNSLPATGSALSNPTSPTTRTIFVSFRGCLELCSSYLFFSSHRTVHFAGYPIANLTFPAYTELPLRCSHCSAAIHCNNRIYNQTHKK